MCENTSDALIVLRSPAFNHLGFWDEVFGYAAHSPLAVLPLPLTRFLDLPDRVSSAGREIVRQHLAHCARVVRLADLVAESAPACSYYSISRYRKRLQLCWLFKFGC